MFDTLSGLDASKSLTTDGSSGTFSDTDLVPLCVDLDGTFVKMDVLVEGLVAIFADRRALSLFTGDRAGLKRRVAELSKLDVALLPYNEELLAYLREQPAPGRRLVLATAADATVAHAVADHVGLFDLVVCSDGVHNLKGEAKALALSERFGKAGFDYPGGDHADLPIWRVARRAIVVNASPRIRDQLPAHTPVEIEFNDRAPLLRSALKNEYQIFYQIHTVAGKELIDIAQGVLSGHPQWRAWQARLLGPLTFAGFEAAAEWVRFTSPAVYSAFERIFSLPNTRDLAALDAFAAMMIVAKNLACFVLLLRYSGSLVKTMGGSTLGSIVAILLSHYWLFVWDQFELVFFCFLAYVMFSGKKPTAGFFLVYVLSLSNRESAAFFGVWLLCYAAASRLIRGRTLWRDAGWGILLVFIAVVYVMILRQALLVESTLGHEVGSPWGSSPIQTENGTLHRAFGNHLLVLGNAIIFLKNLGSTHFYVDAYAVALVLHGGLFLRVGIQRQDPTLAAIGAFTKRDTAVSDLRSIRGILGRNLFS